MKSALAIVIGVTCAINASGQALPSPTGAHGGVPYEVMTLHAETHVSGFELVFDLPVIKGSPELAAVVDRTMKTFREESTSSLRSYCAERLSAEREEGEPEDRCEGKEEWSFEVAFADDHLLSIVISSFSDTKGAAHPSHCTEAYTWTVRNPRLLTMGDLFAHRRPYLPRVSEIARAKLRADSDLADLTDLRWLNEGTAPTAENFRVWFVTHHGITIIFNEYQVAAYVAGPQTVEIAFSELESLLDLRGPVGYLAK